MPVHSDTEVDYFRQVLLGYCPTMSLPFFDQASTS